VAFDYEILDAINDGWLTPIEQQMVNVAGLDYSTVKTTAGDLNGGELARILEYEENLHRMATPSIEIIGDKRAIVFTASVAQAERLSEIFNRHKQGRAAWVCGNTPKEQRQKLLADFADGKLQIVCNCGVLTEGFDDPGVEVIIMGRPTKSRSLYAQMVGRATRPLPGIVDGPETPDARRAAIATSGKPSCLVVDFVGNSGRHKLITSADILGGKVSDEAIDRAILKAQQAGQRMRMDKLLELTEEEIKKEKEKAVQAEEARRLKLRVAAKWNTTMVNPFDVFNLSPVKSRGWDKGKQLSEKQRALLEKQGINPDTIEYGPAKQLLNELFRRFDGNMCSYKQAKLLKKHGLPTEVSRDTAKRLIDAIANNGWRKTPGIEAMAEQLTMDEVPF
jgi:superfamily II DNA or RNA helicase